MAIGQLRGPEHERELARPGGLVDQRGQAGEEEAQQQQRERAIARARVQLGRAAGDAGGFSTPNRSLKSSVHSGAWSTRSAPAARSGTGRESSTTRDCAARRAASARAGDPHCGSGIPTATRRSARWESGVLDRQHSHSGVLREPRQQGLESEEAAGDVHREQARLGRSTRRRARSLRASAGVRAPRRCCRRRRSDSRTEAGPPSAVCAQRDPRVALDDLDLGTRCRSGT